MAGDIDARGVTVGGADRAQEILGVKHADDVFRLLAPERMRVYSVASTSRTNSSGGRSALIIIISVRWIMTLEDILEEIVGDISDEQDVVVAGVRAQPDGSVVVDGSVPIRDLNRAMDWRLPDGEATTVAGLVIHEARSIPERGQSFTFHGFRFRVLRRERNRITALRIPVPRAEGDEPKRSRDGQAAASGRRAKF